MTFTAYTGEKRRITFLACDCKKKNAEKNGDFFVTLI